MASEFITVRQTKARSAHQRHSPRSILHHGTWVIILNYLSRSRCSWSWSSLSRWLSKTGTPVETMQPALNWRLLQLSNVLQWSEISFHLCHNHTQMGHFLCVVIKNSKRTSEIIINFSRDECSVEQQADATLSALGKMAAFQTSPRKGRPGRHNGSCGKEGRGGAQMVAAFPARHLCLLRQHCHMQPAL